jgi:hypothetical protein
VTVAHGVKSGSGGFGDGQLWISVVVGLGLGGLIAFLGLPSYFNSGLWMEVLGYSIFVLGGGLLGMIVGSLLLRPDAGH